MTGLLPPVSRAARLLSHYDERSRASPFTAGYRLAQTGKNHGEHAGSATADRSFSDHPGISIMMRRDARRKRESDVRPVFYSLVLIASAIMY